MSWLAHCRACLFTESYTLALFKGYALSHILVYDCGAIGDIHTVPGGGVYLAQKQKPHTGYVGRLRETCLGFLTLASFLTALHCEWRTAPCKQNGKCKLEQLHALLLCDAQGSRPALPSSQNCSLRATESQGGCVKMKSPPQLMEYIT